MIKQLVTFLTGSDNPSIGEYFLVVLSGFVLLILVILVIYLIADSYTHAGESYSVKISEKIYRPNGYNVSEAYILIFTSGDLSGKIEIPISKYAKINIGDTINVQQRISVLSKTISYDLNQ